MSHRDYDCNPYNKKRKIKLVDSNGDFISHISQIVACRLLNRNICKLIPNYPPTVQFNSVKENWNWSLAKKKQIDAPLLPIRQNILYGNYAVQSPEGELMFRCGAGKILWYLNRDLIETITVDPPVFRLRFLPNGNGHRDDIYYLTPKENVCVVCGTTEELCRHHVLPYVFRKYFPEEIKDHNYHDVLLMCYNHHQQYEVEAGKLKQRICKEFGIDISGDGRTLYDRAIGRVVSVARALKNHGDVIPESRKLQLQNIIKDFIQKSEIADEDLDAVISKRERIFYILEGYRNYGQCVVEKVTDLQAFTEKWRRHFLDTMNPQFMPQHWSVEKPILRKTISS